VENATFQKVLASGLNRVIAAEPDVTRYDTIVGDGDCGVGLKRGAEAVLKFLGMGTTNHDVINAVSQIIPIIENTMDGTSGAIYAIFLNSLAHGLREQDAKSSKPISATEWAGALKYALDALETYTPAKPGDRTLVDALDPFVKSLVETGDIATAAAASQKGTESTKSMKASLGRSVYVGGESEWIGKIPDPGAYGLSEFVGGLADAFK
jgi:dihydroxyacetone kinase